MRINDDFVFIVFDVFFFVGCAVTINNSFVAIFVVLFLINAFFCFADDDDDEDDDD